MFRPRTCKRAAVRGASGAGTQGRAPRARYQQGQRAGMPDRGISESGMQGSRAEGASNESACSLLGHLVDGRKRLATRSVISYGKRELGRKRWV